MSKSNVVALFTALPVALQTLASELILNKVRQDAKADPAEVVNNVLAIFAEPLTGEQQTAGGAGNTDAEETQQDEKPLTAAQKKKAAAEAKKKADAEKTDTKKKPAAKKETKPEIDLTPFKEQVGDFLEWLGSDKEDEIAKILEEFDAETADDVADESYTEFYKLVRELTAEEFDLSEVEDLLAA